MKKRPMKSNKNLLKYLFAVLLVVYVSVLSFVIVSVVNNKTTAGTGNISIMCNIGQNFIQPARNDFDFFYTKDNTVYIEDVNIGIANGLSMQPTAFTGNTIITQDYIGQELKEGMIISYKTNKTAATHRIVAIYDYGVIVRGDNNINTESVSIDEIKEVVIGILFT